MIVSSSFSVLAVLIINFSKVNGHPYQPTPTTDLREFNARKELANAPPNCFPAIGFTMPQSVPSSLTNWWCDHSTEYAFVGFSYEVTACQSLSTLTKEFKDIRNTFNGRYVRIYSACDREGFYNDVINAAWSAGLGVHALIWTLKMQFGWDDPNIWKTRRDALLGILHSNAKAKYVVRALQFGSEPLYDYALDAGTLAAQVTAAKANLSSLHIPVTISEMAYGYQEVAYLEFSKNLGS
ncbi:hypothetical protein JR316_0006404 [Psilocybe cubensis]|uniref:Uncharacterized protein n=1 Tax=Psilocybe cubensis TaxID=181762 RepID=A0ACB8H2F1_PSICU|nr:hypothetical protein JR316_0006404 [Psilocybe cubensis]KAH9481874.1 hypothetical protein JR316_0006404 [Psilocybe cubensis]